MVFPVQKPAEGKPAAEGPKKPVELPQYKVGDKVATRKAYGDALVALGAAYPDVVALDGEVSNSTYAQEFAKAYPGRFFEQFIAEQQLISSAVGMQVRGGSHLPQPLLPSSRVPLISCVWRRSRGPIFVL